MAPRKNGVSTFSSSVSISTTKLTIYKDFKCYFYRHLVRYYNTPSEILQSECPSIIISTPHNRRKRRRTNVITNNEQFCHEGTSASTVIRIEEGQKFQPQYIKCSSSSVCKSSIASTLSSRLISVTPSSLHSQLASGSTYKVEAHSMPKVRFAYAALLLLSTACSLCTATPCVDTPESWWNPILGKCIPCTVCEGELIPLRPCQLHRDTICGSIYDLKIDWVVLAKTEPNWKERRKSYDFIREEEQNMNEETISLDWQTLALLFSVVTCLLFFIVAACILINHMRQWRRMEKRLDQDVEELSTKLMAKLAEVQSLEGGTFFIGNADALRVPETVQPQHVLLAAAANPILKSTQRHHHDRRILKTLQPGNVYIEESS